MATRSNCCVCDALDDRFFHLQVARGSGLIWRGLQMSEREAHPKPWLPLSAGGWNTTCRARPTKWIDWSGR
jgi:hypothetical protein